MAFDRLLPERGCFYASHGCNENAIKEITIFVDAENG
jgi:hypothetical protein